MTSTITLDQVVKKISPFTGDMKEGRRDYERAKQGVELLDQKLEAMQETIKEETGFSKVNIPKEKHVDTFTYDGIVLKVTSVPTTKKPQYKTAVTQMENYLVGVGSLLSEGRVITGIVQEKNQWYIRADKLLEQFETIKAGIMVGNIRQSITYKAPHTIDVPQELDLSTPDLFELHEENAKLYVQMNQIKEMYKSYIEAYEAKLETKKDGIVKINTRAGIEKSKKSKEMTQWKDIIEVFLGTAEQEGELHILADAELSLGQKKRRVPQYKLITHNAHGVDRTYVAISSVYRRINDLKEIYVNDAKRTAFEPIEIV